MSNGVVLSVSTIIGGVFYRFGEPLPYTRETLPKRLRNYIAEPATESPDDNSPSLNFVLGERYSVDRHGHRRAIQREALNLMQAQEEQEAIEAALAQEPDAQVKAAMAVAEADHQAQVSKEISQQQYKAQERQRADEVAQEMIAEQDREVAGIRDVKHQITPHLSEPEPAPEAEERHPPQPKPRRMKMRFIRRGSVWCRAKKIKHPRPGEAVWIKQDGEFVQIGTVNKNHKLPAAPYLED